VGELGTERQVSVTVQLGSLAATDVAVQVLHGPVGAQEELGSPLTATDLTCDDPGGHPAVYRGTIPCDRPGRYGFTVRVVPSHPDLATPLELGRVTLP
jgi:starch phosphorylase